MKGRRVKKVEEVNTARSWGTRVEEFKSLRVEHPSTFSRGRVWVLAAGGRFLCFNSLTLLPLNSLTHQSGCAQSCSGSMVTVQ